MFYFIYLFSSLILICNNFANSNEQVRKIVWSCASEKCDTPISDVVTTTKLPAVDHSAKLKFEIGSKGTVYKKPEDGSEFWFVEIENEKGYVKKSHLREQRKHNLESFKVEGDYPFSDDNNVSGGTEKVTATPPRIVDGTSIYDNYLSESDNNESFAPPNSAESTPHLDSKDVHAPNQIQSTFADSVDQNKSGLQTGDVGSNSTLSPDQKDSLPGVKTESDSKAASDNTNSGNVGNGSISPLDDYDDEEAVIEEEMEEEEEEEHDEESSDSLGTNNSNQGEKTNPNIVSNNVSQNDQTKENSTNIDTISPSETTEQIQVKGNAKEPVDNSYTPPNNPELKDSVYNQTSDNTNEQYQKEVASNKSQPGSSTPKEQSTPSRYINNRSPYVVSHMTRNAPKRENDASARNVQDEPAENQLDPSKLLMDKQPDPQYGPTFQPPLNYANDSMSSSSAFDHSTPPPAQDTTPSPADVHDSSTPSPANTYDSLTHSPPGNVQDGHSSTPSPAYAYDSSTHSPPGNVHDSSTPSPAYAYDSSTPSPAYAYDSSTHSPPGNVQDGHSSTPSPANVHDSSTISPANAHDSYNPPPANTQDSSTPPIDNVQDGYSSTPSPANAPDSSFSPSVNDYEPSTPLPGNVDGSERNIEEPDVPSTVEPSAQEVEHETPTVEKEGEDSFSTETSNSEPPSESGSSLDDVSTDPPNVRSDNSVEESLSNEDETQSITNDNLSQDNKHLEDKTRDDVLQNIVETAQEQMLTGETRIRDSSGFYSSVSSFFSSLTELFNKSELPTDRQPLPPMDQKPMEDSTPATAPSGYCFDGESCGGLERPIGGEDQPALHWSQHYPNVDVFKLNSVPLSFNSIMYICITSVVVLLFSLGYYYIDNSQNSSCLVAKVNQLGQELFVTKKERDTLEDQLLKIKENCNVMDSSKLKQDSKLTSLKKALEESENSRGQLEEKVLSLEKEVETLMEQGLEMHKLLSDTITDEDRSQMLLSNVDELKESLSEKLNQIVTLTNQLDKKNEEIQMRQIDVRNANDRITDLERKLESCKADTEESFAKKLQDQQQKNIKLQKLLEEKGVSIARLENELAKTKAERDSAEARASSAEAGLQSAHSVGAGEARQAWLDSTAVRAALVTANKQNEALQQNISEINFSNKSLQDKISNLNEEMSSLNLKYENVEKEKVNVLTKLQVLSDYFKEKETKLQEELGVKESQWLQKETEDHTIYEQMKSLREEIASYKSQNDKLKGEILEQEASYKVQIANEEQKSYDNWVALRQAERKVKELQMESAHFRNRLTQIETANQSSIEALNPNGLDKSSFSAPSPPFMMLPPLPPSEFFPLPPPPIHPSASRPPPLGRISSPQLPGEMIPPPPLLPFDMYPPPPSSTPPPPLPLYKPQPRDRPPPPKDSPPSNYSSESVNDKPPRRRRR